MNRLTKLPALPLVTTLLGMTAMPGYAAVNFNGATYSQNFDTLISTGTGQAWSNDSTLPGWHLFRQPSPGAAITAYTANNGGSTAGSFYSYGATGSSERALGGLGSGGSYFGSPASGAIAGWIAFAATNTSGATIAGVNIAFDGEQWRNGGNTSAQAMSLEYGFGASFDAVPTWTAVGGSFAWTSPVATASAAAVDGNGAGLVSGRGGLLSHLNWASGSTLWIRWVERNDTGNDHGLAIDNFSLSLPATPGVTINQSGGNTEVTEGGATDTYTVALNAQPTANVTVAVNSDSQVSTNPTLLTFTPGNWNVAQTVTVTAVDDTAAEGPHSGVISHAATSGDSRYEGISIAAVTANITDNDALPNLSINNVSKNEGNSGTSTFTFTVSLSAPAGANGVSFDIATANGTASAGSDFVGKTLTSQTIPAGGSSYTFTVTVNGDTAFEADENFFVNVTNVSHATLSDGQGTGTIVNDDAAPGNACGDPATKIASVQGSGPSTPLAGQTVSVEGIVVGDFQGTSSNSLRGFFVQEEDADADGNPATSEGIFVFDGNIALANVNVADKVRVTGTVGEFSNITQLSNLSQVQVCASHQAIPTRAAVTLPVPGVPSGNLATATAAVDKYFEAFESMLVTFPAQLKVSEYFQLDRFGELVLSQGGRIPTFTNVSNPSQTGYINHQIKLLRRQIVLDDGNDTSNFYSSTNSPLPYPTGGLSLTNRFRGGDSIVNLSGILQLKFGAWRLRPVEQLFDYTFTPSNPRKANPPSVGGTLKVASFNVLNYFTTLDTTASNSAGNCGPDGIQDCRGADSAAELSRQTAKLSAAICGINADIIGLLELENNASASLQAVATAANAVNGCGPYSFINTGIIGGDAIKVGLLYKPGTVSPVGGHALLTTSVDSRFIDSKNRPSLAQTFRQTSTGEKLTIAINHLKSKGSDCNDVGDPDTNDGQGNCNLTRENAALALVDWLASHPTGDSDPDFLIIGDLNSYAKEDPIKAIEKGSDGVAGSADDYTNLVRKFGGAKAYSYVFDGQTGYLDHALASASLAPQVTGTADWHINADEPPAFDYNDTIVDPGEASFEAKSSALPLYAPNQFRTSDHDPVTIGLKLGTDLINSIDGTAARDTLTGTAGKDRITGLAGADSLTGGAGRDEFVYVSTLDGIDTITDFSIGEDKIDLAALLLAIGYQGSDPLADGIIKFAVSAGNTVVYLDTDGNGPAVKRALVIVNNIGVSELNNAANFIF